MGLDSLQGPGDLALGKIKRIVQHVRSGSVLLGLSGYLEKRLI